MVGVSVETDSFETQAEQMLELLATAVDGDRVVLLLTDPGPVLAQQGTLLLEAPAGSAPPGPDHPLGLHPAPKRAGAPPPGRVPRLGDPGVDSVVALPFKVGDKVIGMLSASSSHTDHFSPARVRVMTAAVDSLGALYARIEQNRRIERLTASSETMYTVARLMGAPGSFDEKADAMLRLVGQATGGAAAGLLATPRGGDARWVAGAPAYARDGSPVSLSAEELGRSVASRTLKQGIATNRAVKADDRPVAQLDAQAVSALAVPAKAEGETIGVLLVVSQEADAFPREQVRLIAAIGESMGTLLANAQLGREVNVAVEREYQRLEAVQAAAAQLAIVDSPDEALHHLVEAARQMVGAKYGGVAVWNLHGNVKTLIKSRLSTVDGPTAQADALRLNNVLGLVHFSLVEKRKRVIRVDEPAGMRASDESALPLNSLLGLPFTGRDGSSGGFFLMDKEGFDRFTAEDERLLGLFSAMASVLLDNIRLYSTGERERKTLSAIQSSMSEGLIVLDEDGQVMFCNPAAEALLDAEQAQIRGKSLRAWVLRSKERFDTPEHAERLAKLLTAASPSAIEVAMSGTVGRELAVSLFPSTPRRSSVYVGCCCGMSLRSATSSAAATPSFQLPPTSSARP